MLKTFQFDVPEGSQVYADKAYNDYTMEDVLLEASHIQLYRIRKKSSTRTLPISPMCNMTIANGSKPSGA
jgi:hypothetical protein